MNRNRRYLQGLVASGALIFAAACSESRDTGAVTTTTNEGTSTTPTAEAVEERDNALVRVVNAIPGQATDIYAGDSLAFSNIAFKSVTDFKEMPDDYFGFRVVKPGMSVQDNTLAENREKLGDGAHYTIVAIPDNNDDADSFGELRVLHDDPKPITSGKARVRFIHAVPGLDDELSIFPRGSDNPLVDGVNFKMEAGWNEEDPWSGTLDIRTEDKKTRVGTIPNVKLEANRTYTFVLTGRPSKVEAIQIRDDVARDPDVDNAVPDTRDTIIK